MYILNIMSSHHRTYKSFAVVFIFIIMVVVVAVVGQ